VRRFTIRIAGKKFGQITVRALSEAAAKAALHDTERVIGLASVIIVSDAYRIYQVFVLRYPTVLKGIEKPTFAEMVKEAMTRGKRSYEALRGLIVEKMGWDLTETKDMHAAMEKVTKALAKRFGTKWSAPRLVANVTDGEGKQLGDLLLISTAPDGRVWIMAVIESKSLSNTVELSKMEGKELGQHMWDWVRAKTRGVIIDGKVYKPGKVLCEPVPAASRASTDAVVSVKSAATRQAEMTGYYTQFIAFVPKDLTAGQIRNISRQGIQIETWLRPFDLDDYAKFHRALLAELKLAGL